MKIIDCHVHPQAVENYAEALEHLLQHMRSHGIGGMIASDLGDGWLAYPDKEKVRQANARLKTVCGKFPGELFYLVYINPQLDNWQEELALHEKSACGVKLWVSLRSENNKSDLANSVKVIEAAAARQLPVLIHCFERTDGVSGGSVGIDEIIYFAGKVPACQLVAAHSNGNWRSLIAKAERVPENIFFDVSGGYPERTMVRRLVETFGSERILYGSDAPGRSFGSQLSKVFSAGLTEFELNNILYENCRKLFKLPEIRVEPEKNLPHWNMPNCHEDNFCFAGKSPFWDHAVSVTDLVKQAQKHHVEKLYAASLSAIKSPDFYAENLRWQQETAAYKIIEPLAVADLLDKEQTLRQLDNMSNFAGVWVSPYLHCWGINDNAVKWFWQECEKRRIKVWINCALSDDRFRDERLVTRPVSNEEIKLFGRTACKIQYVLQGTANLVDLCKSLPENFALEYSRLSDGEYLAEQLFAEDKSVIHRLCRGSEYPFREFDAVDAVLNGTM